MTNVNFNVCPELEINPISTTIPVMDRRPVVDHENIPQNKRLTRKGQNGLPVCPRCQISGGKKATPECQAAPKQTQKNDGDGLVRTPQLVRIVIRVQATSQQYHCWFAGLIARQDFSREKVSCVMGFIGRSGLGKSALVGVERGESSVFFYLRSLARAWPTFKIRLSPCRGGRNDKMLQR